MAINPSTRIPSPRQRLQQARQRLRRQARLGLVATDVDFQQDSRDAVLLQRFFGDGPQQPFAIDRFNARAAFQQSPDFVALQVTD